MTLLKDDGTLPPKPDTKVLVIAWPTERLSQGLGLSKKDGWNLGIGFWLAAVIGVPLILLAISCVIGMLVVIGGGSLGALM